GGGPPVRWPTPLRCVRGEDLSLADLVVEEVLALVCLVRVHALALSELAGLVEALVAGLLDLVAVLAERVLGLALEIVETHVWTPSVVGLCPGSGATPPKHGERSPSTAAPRPPGGNS